MTNQFALPIFILIKPSPWLTSGIVTIHLGAALALCAADLYWQTKCLVMFVVAACFTHTLLIHVLQKHAEASVQLLLTTDAEWWLTCVNGLTFSVKLVPGAFVHPLLTVLSFQAEKRRHIVILTPDIVDADMFRRLRVRLRFQHDVEMRKV